MVFNDNACLLVKRGALESIASRARSYRYAAGRQILQREVFLGLRSSRMSPMRTSTKLLIF